MKGASADYTFGIEEEFFLSDRRTGRPPRRVAKALVAACRERLGDCVTHELQQAQIEIVSPVYHDHEAAATQQRRLRRDVAAIVAGFGFDLVAAGTHPLGLWQRQRPTEVARYRRLVEAFQIIGRRDVVCGLHVHVGIPVGVDRVALMNRLMPWLPLFLALSTSSPFWNRGRTGLPGYRLSTLAEWPRTGVPDFFADERDYAAFVDCLVRAEALKDASELWWMIRPSPTYPTLELRVADACTRVGDSLALAALFRCLVRAHVRVPDLGARRSSATRRVIEENVWRAQRHGLAARFIVEAGGPGVSVAQALDDALDKVAADARELGSAATLESLRGIPLRGTSADGQLACYDAARANGATHSQALRRVTDWLVEHTLSGCESSDPLSGPIGSSRADAPPTA